jgi:hypothetical protein
MPHRTLTVTLRTIVGGDIQATFKSVLGYAASNTRMASVAGPNGGPLGGGHWNDADSESRYICPLFRHRTTSRDASSRRRPVSYLLLSTYFD